MLAEQDRSTDELSRLLACSTSVVYDHISGMNNNLEDTDFQLGKSNGRYTIITPPEQDGPVNAHQTGPRANNVAKQTITKNANKFFAEIEDWKDKRTNFPQPVADGGLQHTERGLDLTFHITDCHFGDEKTNVVQKPDGSSEVEVIFSSEIAEARIRFLLRSFMEWADELEAAGYTIDNVNVLFGGDIVTNEAIYNGQAFDVDETILEQLTRTVALFEELIGELAARFPTVQVVFQNGNHGEFRVDGSSGDANADDFLACFLDHNIRKSAFTGDHFDNVTVVYDEHEYYTNFWIRGTWRGHLRHGQNTIGHVATSSGKKEWGSWRDEHQYDLGFYGHRHQFKNEHYNGRRIFMGGTIAPPSEYAESMGEFGEPCGYFVASSDDAAFEKCEYVGLEGVGV